MTHPHVQSFFDTTTNSVSYVVSDPATNACAIIDPVLDYDAVSGRTSRRSAESLLAFVRAEGLTPHWLLETHAHADHVSAGHVLRQETGAKIGIGARIVEVQKTFGSLFNMKDLATDGRQFDRLFADGEEIALGKMKIRVMHTPGHTPACVTYLVGDAAFIGDTMFMPDYGSARVDFPGGNAAALYKSVRKILALPESTRIFCCHDYKAPGRDKFAWETTVAQQRRANLHVRDGVSEDEFVAMRTARDKTLNMPALLIPAIQLNIRAGALPPAEDNGVAYVKVPLNAI
ncbi:MAG: MBL fold metallo-hydrolase [Proteobacteria bacterium]|nr:MBL fold metallo-hydrolase [Pseudomonadota bacterium]